MKINEEIIITHLYLDGHEVPVPEGLSEILNRTGAWVYDPEPRESRLSSDYEREVVQVNGHLRTRLIYIGDAKKKRNATTNNK